MFAPPAVLIPPRSPDLEPVALAVLAGVSDSSEGASRPVIVTGPSGALDVSSDAPIVFVGWHGEGERSRQLASEILAALARQPPTPRPVALFETSVLGASGVSSPVTTTYPRDCPGLRFLGTPERFILRAGGDRPEADPWELARARRWAAQTYRRWSSTSELVPTRSPRTESTRSTVPWTGWCGAFE